VSGSGVDRGQRHAVSVAPGSDKARSRATVEVERFQAPTACAAYILGDEQ